jgi:hypothetical protein
MFDAYIYLILHGRSVFNDFGNRFTCVDPTGEQPLTGMIAEVDKVGRNPGSESSVSFDSRETKRLSLAWTRHGTGSRMEIL